MEDKLRGRPSKIKLLRREEWDNPRPCGFCGLRFSSIKKLKRHKEEAHSY